MTMTAMRMNARASTVMTSTTRRMVLLPSRRHDGLARFRLARRLRDARTRAESSSSDDTAVDERRSEELASSSSLSSRRTILGVERSTGEAIRDWDECVEWRERKPPSDETLGLLDASILALALPGVAELLLDPVMGPGQVNQMVRRINEDGAAAGAAPDEGEDASAVDEAGDIEGSAEA